MRKLKQIRLALLFLWVSAYNPFVCNAQENITSNEPFNIEDVIYSMCLRNDRFNPNLYTGMISFNIPLYTYKDPDFELPVYMEYVSGGLKTNDPIGYLGLGWDLNAGGSVTRVINGIPDEEYLTFINGLHDYCFGYWSYHESGNKDNEDNLFRNGVAVDVVNKPPVYNWALQDGINTETSFDIFSFNFGKHKGRFCLGPDTIYVFNANHPHGEYNIEIIRGNISALFPSLEFIITTGDGYKYIFERAVYLENGSGLWRKPEFKLSSSLQRIANIYWPLVRIEAPNGRKVVFEYDSAEFNASSRPYQSIREEMG